MVLPNLKTSRTKIEVLWNAQEGKTSFPCLTRKIKVVRSFETSIAIHHSTYRHVLDTFNHQQHHYANLKPLLDETRIKSTLG
jgi:hypothetical protein